MSIFERIIEWNKERNLTGFNEYTERNLLLEEYDEFEDACYNGNIDEMVDALCDIIVVATGSLFKLGYNPDQVMNETLKEIESRKGEINKETGKFEKFKDIETYKAEYDKCKKV